MFAVQAKVLIGSKIWPTALRTMANHSHSHTWEPSNRSTTSISGLLRPGDTVASWGNFGVIRENLAAALVLCAGTGNKLGAIGTLLVAFGSVLVLRAGAHGVILGSQRYNGDQGQSGQTIFDQTAPCLDLMFLHRMPSKEIRTSY